MKFQNPNLILFEWTDTQMEKRKFLSLLNFFKVGGIKIYIATHILNLPIVSAKPNILEHSQIIYYTLLTLKVPITTAADDKLCKIFPNFQKK